MTKPTTAAGTITHDVAARLIGVTPAELTALVNGGQVRRADKNAYSLPVLVQDYIGHIKAENERRITAPKQADIAEHMDLSERSVREFLSGAGLDHKQCTIDEIRVGYIRHLREQAAGRAASGDLDLATERAMLAREQRVRIEMQNAVTRGELAPMILMEEVLAKTASKVAGVLDAIPGMVRRRVPLLTADDIELIAGEIAKARNTVATMSMDDMDDEEEPEPEIPAIIEEETD
ncbi:terminase small subunit [Malikia spinosa]|uniref:terminase small subunit n=1 Tax=Malikia spinosa TaxID=86180 RepID=UPI002FD8BA0B